MFDDDNDVKPQNKSGNNETILPLPPAGPFEPMPAMPLQIPKPDEDKRAE